MHCVVEKKPETQRRHDGQLLDYLLTGFL